MMAGMSLRKCIASIALLALVGGCAFTGVRREPKPAPTYAYANPGLQSALHDIPVSIDYVDCVEMAMVNKRSIFGSTSFSGTFPLRRIVLREFGRFVNENMRTPLDGEAEKVVLKIYSKRILVEQGWSKSRAEMVFDVLLLDSRSESARPYFRGSFKGEWSSEHEDDEVVPESVYRSIGVIVSAFAKALHADRSAMRRLSLVARPDARIAPPSLRSIDFGELRGGVLSGGCEVDCNDWDGFNADKWARGQINSSCCMKLGIDPSRVRVVYMSDMYDPAAKRWKYEFRAFARAPIVLDYDPATRSGVCIGDLGLLGLSMRDAAYRMKSFIIAEMKTHAGAVKSANGMAETSVRFNELKSDPASNLLHIGFSLPY